MSSQSITRGSAQIRWRSVAGFVFVKRRAGPLVPCTDEQILPTAFAKAYAFDGQGRPRKPLAVKGLAVIALHGAVRSHGALPVQEEASKKPNEGRHAMRTATLSQSAICICATWVASSRVFTTSP